jgi:hypothetical protein
MGRNTSGENHGYFGTRAYDVWLRMRNRSYRKIDSRYPALGGQGIDIRGNWRYDFNAFLEDRGFPPYDHGDGGVRLERRDKAGDFTPDNCYWRQTDASQQESAVTKFTMQIAEEIRAQHRAGATLSELARDYGSTQWYMSRICSNKRWRQLE